MAATTSTTRAKRSSPKSKAAQPKTKSRRVNKTKNLMLSQSKEQNEAAGLRIEDLLAGELKETLRHFIGKYGKTFERKLGLTRDDLMNDMREQVWKGLLTHSPNGGANLKTWLNKLINNRFLVLLRRSTIQKHNSIDYYGDVFSTTGIDDDSLITEETGETIFEKRQVIMQEIESLSYEDKFIYMDLILGKSLSEMVSQRKIPKMQVISAINRIDDLIKRRTKK